MHTKETESKRLGFLDISNWDEIPKRTRGPQTGMIAPSRGKLTIVKGTLLSGEYGEVKISKTGNGQGTAVDQKKIFEEEFGAEILNWDEVEKIEKGKMTGFPKPSKAVLRFVCTVSGKVTERIWYKQIPSSRQNVLPMSIEEQTKIGNKAASEKKIGRKMDKDVIERVIKTKKAKYEIDSKWTPELQKKFEDSFGAKILNWDEVKKRTMGENIFLPTHCSNVKFICSVCGKEGEKQVTPKSLSNGNSSMCQNCSKTHGNMKSSVSRTGVEKPPEATLKLKLWWKKQSKGLGTKENNFARKKIEDILSNPVKNWESFEFTAGGFPKEDSRLIFQCSKCKRESSQLFRSMTELSSKCGGCMKSEAYVGQNFDGMTSAAQREIHEFIVSIGEKASMNHKGLLGGMMEADIFIEDKKTIIEYNGIVFHKEKGTGSGSVKEYGKEDRKYHLKKTLAAEKLGYRMIHIFEDEWKKKKEIVKSRLASILGKSTISIGARECEIVRVYAADERPFFDNNHIQGYTRSMACYGLMHEGKLVSAMSFSSPRIGIGSGGNHWELVRFANILNSNVQGSASRLLKAFQEGHPKTPILSFADRRWSNGGVYERLGFKKVRESEPNHWYYDTKINKFHRLSFRKNKLVMEFGADESKTEFEIMNDMGYYRVWDCGSLVYRLDPLNIPC